MGEFNLFGDPVVPAQEGPGRPAYVWSRENSNKVLLAFARGLTVKDAATAIGMSAPSLRKVYFSEVRQRDAARLRMEMTQLARLNKLADAGNVAAEKELMKLLDRLRQRDQVAARAPTEPVRAGKLGKKEKAVETAREVAGLYGPRPGPSTATIQ